MANRSILNRLLMVFMLVYIVVACSADDAGKAEESKPGNVALMLEFKESEPGIEPYVARILINDKYMRMDDGTSEGDFAVLDRSDGTIYNITHESQNILVIKKQPVKMKSPIKLTMDAKKSVDVNAPKVAGKQTVQYDLIVNNTTCTTLVVVPDMLPRAIEAMREFQRTLAGTHAVNLSKTPVEMMDACFLAYDVFAPVKTLQHGFPIYQLDSFGKARSLVNYDESFKDTPGLYELPKAYSRTAVGSVR